MKTITVYEIDELLKAQAALIGSELQQVRYNEKSLQLNFYKKSINYWLTISLKPGVPYFFMTANKVRLIENLKKPLSLFLVKHFVKSKLIQQKRKVDLGRVVEFDFGDFKKLEISLITGRTNISAFVENRVVHAFKPKEILAKPDQGIESREIRKIEYFEEKWGAGQNLKKKNQEVDQTKMLNKKESGLKKMKENLSVQENNLWQEFGEWLKSQPEMDEVPESFKKLIDRKQSLSWNIENAFHQKKKLESKKQGTLQRVEELKSDILKLKEGQLPKKESGKGLKKNQPNLLFQAELKGKTIEFPEGRLFIGKSGKDNLKLLRKAQSWYLWLHIKDYPGAYGIFEKLKNSNEVSESSLLEAAKAVIRQSLPKNQKGRFELIYTDCRYVRPIKGAKSGQVTYSHEKVLSVKV